MPEISHQEILCFVLDFLPITPDIVCTFACHRAVTWWFQGTITVTHKFLSVSTTLHLSTLQFPLWLCCPLLVLEDVLEVILGNKFEHSDTASLANFTMSIFTHF